MILFFKGYIFVKVNNYCYLNIKQKNNLNPNIIMLKLFQVNIKNLNFSI